MTRGRNVALALGLFAAAVAELVLRSEPAAAHVAGAALLTLPLALRSRSPWLPYAGFVAGLAVLASVGSDPGTAGEIIAVLAVGYGFGSARGRAGPAGLVAVAVPLVAVLATVDALGDVVWAMGVFVVPPWLAGRVMAGRRQRLDELERLRAALVEEQARAEAAAARLERGRVAAEIEAVLARSLREIVRLAESPPEPATFAALHGESSAAMAELRRLLGVLRGDARAVP